MKETGRDKFSERGVVLLVLSQKRLRILWTVNIVLPSVANQFGLVPTPFGGWLTQMLERLSALPGIQIAVAMRSPVSKLRRIDYLGVTYFAVPQLKKNIFDVSEADCAAVLSDFSPDILHAHGSEMPYTRKFLSKFEGPRILSLQGIVNGIMPYHLGRLPITSMLWDIRRPRRIAIALALILNDRLRFRPRLSAEREIFLLAQYIFGRTIWDHAHTLALNPVARYMHCGEILRDAFYKKEWSYQDCVHRSIFVGNSSAPLKGVHIAVRALALLVRRYPDVKMVIAGPISHSSSKFSLRSRVGYQVYLRSLIKELELESNIVFIGQLSTEKMAEKMCESHVFLLPSLIENSPNTLGEAMVMGVPAVASFVGGVPSMVADEKEALLYRADDPIMLAFQLGRLFDDKALCNRLASSSRQRAKDLYDPDKNFNMLRAAYEVVQSQNSLRSERV